MTYNVGDVEAQGEHPSNVIAVAFGRKADDGGKARIRSGREKLGLSSRREDLRMDHADPADNGMPSDSAYHAPAWGPA